MCGISRGVRKLAQIPWLPKKKISVMISFFWGFYVFDPQLGQLYSRVTALFMLLSMFFFFSFKNIGSIVHLLKIYDILKDEQFCAGVYMQQIQLQIANLLMVFLLSITKSVLQFLQQEVNELPQISCVSFNGLYDEVQVVLADKLF